MTIDLTLQMRHDPTLPTMPVKVNSGSALPIELVGIPGRISGGEVKAVTVEIVNADGQPISAACERVGETWAVLFAASNFERYGFVRFGFRVIAQVAAGDTTFGVSCGGDFEVAASSPSAEPGNPTAGYQIAGDDIYQKSYVADGVQHYVKQSVVYDERVGWGAVWGGDYVKKADGTFEEFTEI